MKMVFKTNAEADKHENTRDRYGSDTSSWYQVISIWQDQTEKTYRQVHTSESWTSTDAARHTAKEETLLDSLVKA